MLYDLTPLDDYLQLDTSPLEVVRLLRHCKYALICCAEYTEDYSGLCDRYVALLQLEDVFMGMDEKLSKLCTTWK